MFSRALLIRATPLKLSAVLRTQVCSRSLSTLRLSRSSAPCTAATLCAQRSLSDVAPKRSFSDEPEPEPRGSCFVGNLPFSVTAEELLEAFSSFGSIEEVRLVTTERGLPSGAGFVKFEAVESAINFVNAHKADPIFILDRELHINHARSRAQAYANDPTPTNTLTLFGYQGGEEDIRELFHQYEQDIKEIRIGEHPLLTLVRKRIFIEFFNIEQATTAKDALNATQDFSRPVIQFAKLRQPRQSALSTFDPRKRPSAWSTRS
ncbi:hypothetical protein BU15DRAFT_46695 [Melanogaster broomeanus]|nr:hypothetical protein BU15DRAFT_46695 [Melanogaster broomeanus]